MLPSSRRALFRADKSDLEFESLPENLNPTVLTVLNSAVSLVAGVRTRWAAVAASRQQLMK